MSLSVIIVFFSSRRRHTRCSRDWSSDVCSSDLVLATAHRQPARTAQTIKCGACRTSARMCDVPRMSAGTLQRARNTPTTMMREITRGETPMVTSFVGASAAPSQAPAAKPQRIPKACKLLRRETSDAGKVSSKLMVVRLALTDPSQDNEPGQKYDQRHPKVDVLQDRRPPPPRLVVFIAIWHQSLPAETFYCLKVVGLPIGIASYYALLLLSRNPLTRIARSVSVLSA